MGEIEISRDIETEREREGEIGGETESEKKKLE